MYTTEGKKIVSTEKAPKAIGPYSQGIKAGDFVFTAGQAGVDPAIGKLVEGGIAEQTEQVLKNLAAVLAGAGLTLADVVKTTVFLATDPSVAGVSGRYFDKSKPRTPSREARSYVGL